MAHFLEDVPFEQLDSCCQRELISRRKNAEVTEKLRQVDRSNQRLDIKANTLANVRKELICSCCSNSTDYPLLVTLRSQRMNNSTKSDDDNDPNEDTDDDSDFDMDDTNIISNYEQEQRNKFLELQLNAQYAQQFGFASHLEDSLEHIIQDISSGYMPYILHVYNPQSPLCAQLDLLLEGLCMQYMGTRFRRLSIHEKEKLILWTSEAVTQSSTDNVSLIRPSRWAGNLNGNTAWRVRSSDITEDGALLCFKDGSLLTSVSSIARQFADSDRMTLFDNEVRKFLLGANVLMEKITSTAMLKQAIGTASIIDEEEDDVEDTRYCDDPSCTRNFPHEHIGGNKGGIGSYLLDTKDDSEIFAPHALTKL